MMEVAASKTNYKCMVILHFLDGKVRVVVVIEKMCDKLAQNVLDCVQ